jgi:hypothetical protein
VLRRRELLGRGLAAGGALAFGPVFWRSAVESAFAAPKPVSRGAGPYGPLGAPDANGLRLPAGFRSRELARSGQVVPGTSYSWPIFPDGSATFPTDDGGFILVVNSETPPDINGIGRGGSGGASAVRFGSDGKVVSAYRILGGTDTNCSGGPTPWGTWLSCEEREDGFVHECDPTGKSASKRLAALGTFSHEAAAVDDVGRRVYLTEDDGEGCFYRFTPKSWPSLAEGTLEVMVVAASGDVTWKPVPDPAAKTTPTRSQVPEATKFKRGEGLWHDSGFVYISTTSDNKVHEYNTVLERITVLYDGEKLAGDPLSDVDQMTASPSGDVFVCEDSGGDDPLDICIITPEGEVTRFLKLTGPGHTGAGGPLSSELTGVAFDPSGKRMYFSSQRGFGPGVTYEVTGPFRTKRLDRGRAGMKVTSPAAVSLKTLTKKGVPVDVLVDQPATLTATVVLTRPGVSGGRSRRITAARAKKTAKLRGGYALAPKGAKAATGVLKGRRAARGRIEVRAVDEAGNVTIVRRALRVTA